mmetsp:Transcript_119855/g.321774  ORF Transcript_119855/g.321774 Transcript_119855/m.321774 type:complete len:106 (-) Transcript_119855:75-392(-)
MAFIMDTLRRGVGKLDIKVTFFTEALTSWLEGIEASAIDTDMRIDKMEEMLEVMPMTSEEIGRLAYDRIQISLRNHRQAQWERCFSFLLPQDVIGLLLDVLCFMC